MHYKRRYGGAQRRSNRQGSAGAAPSTVRSERVARSPNSSATRYANVVCHEYLVVFSHAYAVSSRGDLSSAPLIGKPASAESVNFTVFRRHEDMRLVDNRDHGTDLLRLETLCRQLSLNLLLGGGIPIGIGMTQPSEEAPCAGHWVGQIKGDDGAASRHARHFRQYPRARWLWYVPEQPDAHHPIEGSVLERQCFGVARHKQHGRGQLALRYLHHRQRDIRATDRHIGAHQAFGDAARAA